MDILIKIKIIGWLLGRYIRNLLVSLDQVLNTITFGDEDETISSRLGKSQRGDFGVTHKILSYPLAKIVDFIAFTVFSDPDHCATNIEETVGGNALILLYRKKLKEYHDVKRN